MNNALAFLCNKILYKQQQQQRKIYFYQTKNTAMNRLIFLLILYFRIIVCYVNALPLKNTGKENLYEKNIYNKQNHYVIDRFYIINY